jgi:hypothetical protein
LIPTRQQRNAPLSGGLLIVIVRTTVKLRPNFLTGTIESWRTCCSASIAAWNSYRQILLDRFRDRVSLTFLLNATWLGRLANLQGFCGFKRSGCFRITDHGDFGSPKSPVDFKAFWLCELRPVSSVNLLSLLHFAI